MITSKNNYVRNLNLKLYYIQKRTLMKASNNIICKLSPFKSSLQTSNNRYIRPMSYIQAMKVKDKNISSDDTGKHPHIMIKTCEKEDCNDKKCKELCTSLKVCEIAKHLTHNPPIGKFSQYLSKNDTNEEPRNQYATKNSKPNRFLDKETTEELEEKGKIKMNPKVTAYLNQESIRNKL